MAIANEVCHLQQSNLLLHIKSWMVLSHGIYQVNRSSFYVSSYSDADKRSDLCYEKRSWRGLRNILFMINIPRIITIPVRQGEITNMNVKFLPKDASISSAVDVNSWDSNTTIDKDVKL